MASLLSRICLPLLDRMLHGGFSSSMLSDAVSAFERGERGAAGYFLSLARAARLRDPAQLLRAAALSYDLGDLPSAADFCGQALRQEPTNEQGFCIQSLVDMPGPGYMELLQRIHATLRPRAYVEIGTFAGESLRLAAPATRAIGVDPAPHLAQPLPAHARVYAMTSDEFFDGRSAAEALAGSLIDLAFIDGMHLFEYALRDFMKVERLSSPASTILLHDCYPLNRLTAERERRTGFWSGDVWRVIVALRRHRPDLRIHVVATPPTGLAVVRSLDPGSTVLAKNYDAIVAEILALDFAELERDKPGLLNRFPNDWAQVEKLIAA